MIAVAVLVPLTGPCGWSAGRATGGGGAGGGAGLSWLGLAGQRPGAQQMTAPAAKMAAVHQNATV